MLLTIEVCSTCAAVSRFVCGPRKLIKTEVIVDGEEETEKSKIFYLISGAAIGLLCVHLLDSCIFVKCCKFCGDKLKTYIDWRVVLMLGPGAQHWERR